MSMMIETHLGPNTEVHQTHFKRLQWQYRGWRVIPSKMTLISPPTDITGKDNTYIVMFGPITSASFKCDEAQSKYTW